MNKIFLTSVIASGLFALPLHGIAQHDHKHDGHNHGSHGHHHHKDDNTVFRIAEATINSASNSGMSGTATFVQNGGKVTLTLRVKGIKAPGLHAVHLHQIGDCSAPDASSAGGHWNPTGSDHGQWESEHFHKGDIGNIDVKEDGTGTLTLSTDEWCIGCDDEHLNIIGKSVIVHEGPDDFTTQPTGNAGGRIGCGVVQMKQ